MAIARVKTIEEQRAEQKAALERIRNGLATRVRILVPLNACPVCRAHEGAYEFDEVPELPTTHNGPQGRWKGGIPAGQVGGESKGN